MAIPPRPRAPHQERRLTPSRKARTRRSPRPLALRAQAPRRPARLAITPGNQRTSTPTTTDARWGHFKPSHRGQCRPSFSTVRDRPLPPLHTLRGGDRIGLPNWRDGGFDTQAPEPGEPVEISWPTAANVLRAAVRDRGLDIRPSAPGRTVHAIVERMGDLHESDSLKDPWILEQLDVLALRRGMNWFRDRMRRLTGEAAGVPELAEKLEIIESHLEQMTSPGDADQQHELGFSGISKRLGAKSARRWLSWAEDRGLLIRGVTVECLSCGAQAWRAASQLSPPIECPGCGRVIRRPFPPDQIKFTHRASQVLLNVMEADGLSHVLCGSWWRALFRDHFYGIHLGASSSTDPGCSGRPTSSFSWPTAASRSGSANGERSG